MVGCAPCPHRRAHRPADDPRPAGRADPVVRRQRRHARRLHRLRLRPVRRADAAGDEHLAADVPVPGGRHLHLRRQPRLPHPAQPDPEVGRHPAAQGLAAAPDHARPAGLVPPELPSVRRRRVDQAEAGQGRPLPPGPAAGATGGRDRGRGRAGRSASSRAARSGTTSRASTSATPTAGSRRSRSSRPGPRSCTRSTTSPASTPAPARASRCSTTPGSSAPTRSPSPTGSGSPAGTARRTRGPTTSATTAGSRAAG